MDDLVAEFLTETNESIEELDVDLVNLEQNPNDQDLLSKIFRLMHTIKGTCGFLGLPRLEVFISPPLRATCLGNRSGTDHR